MNSRIVGIQNVSFRYRGAWQPALRHVSLEIHRGEFLLVTGPTGSGKSTLLRLINGLIPNFHEGEMEGDVSVLGMNTKTTRPNRLATRVGTVFQFPEEQIVASKVWRDVAFGLENLLQSRQEIRERVDQALAFVGLERLREREVITLSGGEKQRLALASVLAMKPEILLLDEPAAELDAAGRADLIALLVRLHRKEGMTLAIADHRLDDLIGVVDRIVVLNDGETLLDGPPREVMVERDLLSLGVEVPKPVAVWKRLHELGIQLPYCPLTLEEVSELLRQYRQEDIARGQKAIS